MVGVFYSFIGFGDFKLFFCLAFGKKKTGFSCWELEELSWILGGISTLGRGKA